MTLPLTPEILEAAYGYLKATPPFRSWGLPPSDEVRFVVAADRGLSGWHIHKAGGHDIAISSSVIGHTSSLIPVLAHEMVHLYQAHKKTFTRNTQHNAEFKKLMARVSKYHGFDPKMFT